MDLNNFKRRLMTDPQDASLRAERLRGGETFRQAAEDAAAFEARLARAVAVTVPDGLTDEIIRRRDQAGVPSRRWPLALAASVVLAIAVGVMLLRTPVPDDLAGYLAWHWSHDGAQALAMAEDHVPEAQLTAIMDAFDLELGPNLKSQVRFVKLCPAPDGQGAHLVLATESGPMTLYYLPGLESGVDQRLDVDGMHAWIADLESGAVVVVASPEQALTPVAALVRDELRLAQQAL